MIFIHGGIYKICSCGNISSHQESEITRKFPLDIVDTIIGQLWITAVRG